MNKQNKEPLMYTMAIAVFGMILWFSAWLMNNT